MLKDQVDALKLDEARLMAQTHGSKESMADVRVWVLAALSLITTLGMIVSLIIAFRK